MEIKVKVKKATLSVTNKAKARALRRSPSTASIADKTPMETSDEPVKESDVKIAMDTKEDKDEEKVAEVKVEEKKVEEKEADFELLSNPARITFKQQAVLSCDKGQRYVPVKQVATIFCFAIFWKKSITVSVVSTGCYGCSDASGFNTGGGGGVGDSQGSRYSCTWHLGG